MKIGDLRHRVEIQHKTIVTDELKQQSEVWSAFATCWAAIRPLSGREYFAAAQVNAEVTAKIVIRFVQGVTPQMRVLWQGKVFEIVTVINPDYQSVSLELLCKEVIS